MRKGQGLNNISNYEWVEFFRFEKLMRFLWSVGLCWHLRIYTIMHTKIWRLDEQQKKIRERRAMWLLRGHSHRGVRNIEKAVSNSNIFGLSFIFLEIAKKFKFIWWLESWLDQTSLERWLSWTAQYDKFQRLPSIEENTFSIVFHVFLKTVERKDKRSSLLDNKSARHSNASRPTSNRLCPDERLSTASKINLYNSLVLKMTFPLFCLTRSMI